MVLDEYKKTRRVSEGWCNLQGTVETILCNIMWYYTVHTARDSDKTAY